MCIAYLQWSVLKSPLGEAPPSWLSVYLWVICDHPFDGSNLRWNTFLKQISHSTLSTDTSVAHTVFLCRSLAKNEFWIVVKCGLLNMVAKSFVLFNSCWKSVTFGSFELFQAHLFSRLHWKSWLLFCTFRYKRWRMRAYWWKCPFWLTIDNWYITKHSDIITGP